MLTPAEGSVPYSPVRRVGPGRGRDFVVGDIHGSFRLLLDAMDAVNFDESVDRIFSVGDLVDRGPNSELVADFLAQPWFHAIRGNHEQMWMTVYRNGGLDIDELRFNVYRNGAGWWLTVEHERQKAILKALSQLPYVIELETEKGLVGLVHGEVPPATSWRTFIADVKQQDPATLFSALWGQERVKNRSGAGVLDIWRVFSGHTPHLGVGRYGNCFVVDTGAVFGLTKGTQGALTIADVTATTLDLLTPKAVFGKPGIKVVDPAPPARRKVA